MARVILRTSRTGRLENQTILTDSSARCTITVTGERTIRLKTEPAHVWGVADVIQLSQALLNAAMVMQNAHAPIPEFPEVGTFSSGRIDPTR